MSLVSYNSMSKECPSKECFFLYALHNASMRVKDAKGLKGFKVVGNDLQSYILCVVLVLCNITHHHIKKTY